MKPESVSRPILPCFPDIRYGDRVRYKSTLTPDGWLYSISFAKSDVHWCGDVLGVIVIGAGFVPISRFV
ncbi:hypothetical protein [Desulfovibrio inopinatus]|uniref:hypothetical protein n=1 Tax=Desulfovibrio inopinatus TaxID=102109 RepID=UPI00048080B4|nr:hypothetical protein [Desulfovibrio inopinatus]